METPQETSIGTKNEKVHFCCASKNIVYSRIRVFSRKVLRRIRATVKTGLFIPKIKIIHNDKKSRQNNMKIKDESFKENSFIKHFRDPQIEENRLDVFF